MTSSLILPISHTPHLYPHTHTHMPSLFSGHPGSVIIHRKISAPIPLLILFLLCRGAIPLLAFSTLSFKVLFKVISVCDISKPYFHPVLSDPIIVCK